MKRTKSQTLAIESEAKQLLIIAGAGSGKTTVMIDRIMRLVNEGSADPKRVVAITFTNAAADEIRERLNKRTEGLGDSLAYVGTVHGLFLRLIREHFAALALGSVLTVIDEARRKELLAAQMETLRYAGTLEDVIEALKIGPVKLFKIRNQSKAEGVARGYFRNMIENCALDFDMILHFGIELILKLDGGAVKLDGVALTHLFVDEFQDSGAEAVFYREANIENKFVVGDSDQAIFSFRGGNIESLLSLAKEPGWTLIKLEENFRCAVNICKAAQRVIECNSNRYPKKTKPARTEKGECFVIAHPSAGHECAAILNQIQNNSEHTSIAVLTRNNFVADQIRAFLEQAGTPVAKREWPRRPNDWPLVKDAINFLVNPDNDNAAFRVLEAMYGTKDAERRRAAAVATYSPLNSVEGVAEYDTPLDAVTTFLARRLNVCVESREIVTDTINSLPADATLGELSLALAREENRRTTGTGVVVTTVHAAKGREFDIVFLPALEETIFPTSSAVSEGNIEEERRLLYVGITRARHQAFCSWARERREEYGERKSVPMQPSRFIAEIQT